LEAPSCDAFEVVGGLRVAHEVAQYFHRHGENGVCAVFQCVGVLRCS